MEGIISAFRGSHKTKKTNQMIIVVKEVQTKEKTKDLMGKTITWETPGKNKKAIKGKITKPHGNKGAIRAIFERGMPGQSLGKKVTIN